MRKIKIKPGFLILFMMLLAGMLLETWKISQQPIEEWDEARRGINALEMMTTGEYFNYYFLGEVDTFNSKPPLTVWLIAINFKLLGVTNLALRLHSVLAIYLFLILLARIILLYRDEFYAALVLGIVISVQGIIGFHVGRSGDTDSLLLLFLTGFIYYFLRYWDFQRKGSIYLAAVFLGLAFYSKSVAAFIPLPGIAAYVLITRGKRKIVRKEILLSFLISLSIILSWALLNLTGNQNTESGQNIWDRIFSVDLYKRFTDKDFEKGYDPFYVIHVLDMNFSLWNYIMYFGGLVGLYRIFRIKISKGLQRNKLLLLSIFITAGYILILTLSMNKHQWYLAPAYPYFAILTTEFIYFLRGRIKWIYSITITLVIILYIFRFVEINQQNTNIYEFFASRSAKISSSDCVLVDRSVPQHLIFEFTRWNYENARLSSVPDCTGASFTYFGKSFPAGEGQISGQLEGFNLITGD